MPTVQEVSAKLRAMKAEASPAARAAAVAMGALFTAAVVTDELQRYPHEKGTKTPSPPGQPAGLISGDLRRSVKPLPPAPSSGYRWTVTVGGTVPYARIQELGGMAGRNLATEIPARPYLKPAVERLQESGALSKVSVAAFLKVIGEA